MKKPDILKKLKEYKKLKPELEFEDSWTKDELEYLLNETEKEFAGGQTNEQEPAGETQQENTPVEEAQANTEPEESSPEQVVTEIQSIVNDEEDTPVTDLSQTLGLNPDATTNELYAQVRELLDKTALVLDTYEKMYYHKHQSFTRKVRQLKTMMKIQQKVFKV